MPPDVVISAVARVYICACMYMSISAIARVTIMGWLRLVGFLKFQALLQNIVSFIGLVCKRDL